MKDRELLEFAAKAAGIEIHESDDGTLQKRPIWAVTHFVCGQPYGESQWNPLTDDGDALMSRERVRSQLEHQAAQKGDEL